MAQQFVITYADGSTHEAAIGLREQYAIEAKFDVSLTAGEAMRMSWFAYGAWKNLNARGAVSEDFDTWLDREPDIDVAPPKAEGEEAQPGTSPNSASDSEPAPDDS